MFINVINFGNKNILKYICNRLQKLKKNYKFGCYAT
jgi:hypothetical protein